jgi:protein SCO1/2
MPIRIVLFLLLMALAGSLGYFTGGYSAAVPPLLKNYGQVPEFAFRDSTDRPFGSAGLRGKIWVLNFFFTSCRGPCPKMNAEIARLAKRLGGRAEFVSVSSDPETDTPEALRRYKEEIGAGDLSWHFLTAPREQIVSFAQEGLGFAAGEPSLHTTKLILVDRRGTVRGYFSSDSPEELGKLVSAMGELERE